jgi:hypothetical protein
VFGVCDSYRMLTRSIVDTDPCVELMKNDALLRESRSVFIAHPGRAARAGHSHRPSVRTYEFTLLQQ